MDVAQPSLDQLRIFLAGVEEGSFNRAADCYVEALERARDFAALIDSLKYFTKEALIQYYEAMIIRPNRTQVLKSFPKPVLFIIGKEDKAVPLDISLQQCYLPLQSHVHILQQSAHMGMWEETALSNKILADFLSMV